MKLQFLSLALILAAAGCTTTVEDPSYYLDPVERVVNPGSFFGSPFMPNGYTLENGQNFDAAIGLFRTQSTNGITNPNEVPIGRMAFQLNNAPAQVVSATVNNDTLSWTLPGSGISLGYSYANAVPNLYGSPDSMTFSYVDFNGESYSGTLNIVPDFGVITFPDTISMSRECIISYQHPIPNDSIEICVNGLDTTFFVTRPDTGSIVFAPYQLPLNQFISGPGFSIYLYRWNWSTRTTPSGKKIGVYSSMETAGQFIPTKP
jgi:hypothetical protein